MNQMPAPGGVQMPAPGGVQVPGPPPANPPLQQSTPYWLQPPGAQPPKYQAPQGYIAPQANTVNNMVTGLPPQGVTTTNRIAPVTYGQTMPQQYMPQQPAAQQQINGGWKTTVSYAPVQPGVPGTFVQTQDVPVRQIQQPGTGATGFAGGQQP
jgi:hypothetical protein